MTKFPTGNKRIFILIVLLIFLMSFTAVSFGFSNLGSVPFNTPDMSAQPFNSLDVAKKSQPSVFRQEVKPIYLPPKILKFKEKTLDVEEVGVEEGGFLGVPSSWHTAGWYRDSAKPGEEGNIIMDGHYDTNTGAPGAFWELKDLQIGDKVFLVDALGRKFEYLVTQKFYVDIKDPQRARVFEGDKSRQLTLITCGGVWDYASNTYNKRLVIKAEFGKMEKDW